MEYIWRKAASQHYETSVLNYLNYYPSVYTYIGEDVTYCEDYDPTTPEHEPAIRRDILSKNSEGEWQIDDSLCLNLSVLEPNVVIEKALKRDAKDFGIL